MNGDDGTAVNAGANAETHAALKRLAAAVEELDDTNAGRKQRSHDPTTPATTSSSEQHEGGGSSASGTAAAGDDDGGGSAPGGGRHSSQLAAAQRRSIPLSHWREVPKDVQEAYDMVTAGAELLGAASTRYTLMGKASPDGDFGGLAEELRRGAEILAAGNLALHADSMGCGRALRHHVRRATRNALACAVALVRSFLDGTAFDGNVGARRTGAVWESCEAVRKVPRGNRAAVRRDFFQWAKDCNETVEEFQEVVDLGPVSVSDVDSDADGDGDGDDEWDDFCEGGTGDRYTSAEMDVVRPALSLIQCSRGSIALALQACEVAGGCAALPPWLNTTTPEEDGGGCTQHADNDADGDEARARRDGLLRWISTMYEMARVVGVGVTDMGSLLYPPLELKVSQNASSDTTEVIPARQDGAECELSRQLSIQRDWIVALNDAILSASVESEVGSSTSDDSVTNADRLSIAFPVEMTEKASKMRSAAISRYESALDAIQKSRT